MDLTGARNRILSVKETEQARLFDKKWELWATRAFFSTPKKFCQNLQNQKQSTRKFPTQRSPKSPIWNPKKVFSPARHLYTWVTPGVYFPRYNHNPAPLVLFLISYIKMAHYYRLTILGKKRGSTGILAVKEVMLLTVSCHIITILALGSSVGQQITNGFCKLQNMRKKAS